MTIEELDDYFTNWVDPQTGRVIQSTAHRVGNWRPGIVTSTNPPEAEVMGEEDPMPIRFRSFMLQTMREGDVVMFQKVGPVWIAVYEVERIRQR